MTGHERFSKSAGGSKNTGKEEAASTVYSSIPEAAKAAREKTPMILNLFIPIREYGTAEQMIREKRGYIYSAYTEALKLKKEKGGNN